MPQGPAQTPLLSSSPTKSKGKSRKRGLSQPSASFEEGVDSPTRGQSVEMKETPAKLGSKTSMRQRNASDEVVSEGGSEASRKSGDSGSPTHDRSPVNVRSRGWSRNTPGGEDGYSSEAAGSEIEMRSDIDDPVQAPRASRATVLIGSYAPFAICLAGTIMICVGAVQLAVDSRHLVGGGRLVGFGSFLLFAGIPFILFVLWSKFCSPQARSKAGSEEITL